MSSLLWNYFNEVKDSDGKKRGVCKEGNKCKAKNQSVKVTKGTTSGLDNHLKAHHKEKYQEYLALKIQHSTPSHTKRKLPDSEGSNSSPQPLKQCRLSESFDKLVKYDSNHPVQQGFDSRLLDVIVAGFLSFGFADLPEVQELISYLNRRVTVKCSTTYSRQVEEKFNIVLTKVKEIIKSKVGTSCAFTSDLWTSRARDSYISLTAHFIDTDFVLHRWTPYCQYFGVDRHTGEEICKHLKEMVKDIGISEEVTKYCVTDNAANIKLGVRSSDSISESCANHTLQLCIEDSFKESDGMTNALGKCKDIASLTHRSEKSEHDLLSYCSEFQHKPNKLKQENATRWDSAYQNMESNLHHRECINAMGRDDLLATKLVPSLTEWKMIEGACEVLSGFRETTKEWEREKVPTLNLVAKQVYDLQEKLTAFSKDKKKKGFGVQFARVLSEKLSDRFPNLGLENSEVAMANLLDPCLKGIHLKSVGLYDSTVSDMEELSEQLNLTEAEEAEEDSDHDSVKDKLSALDKLKMKFASKNTTPKQSAFSREMEMYDTIPEPKDNYNILEWWKQHKLSIPVLAGLARHILAIPAASSKSERVFSCAGNTVSARRTRLGTEKVEMLVILKQNSRMLKEYDN